MCAALSRVHWHLSLKTGSFVQALPTVNVGLNSGGMWLKHGTQLKSGPTLDVCVAPYWRGPRTTHFRPQIGALKTAQKRAKMGPMFRTLFLSEMVVIRVYRPLVETTLHDESSRIVLDWSGSSGSGQNFENRPAWALQTPKFAFFQNVQISQFLSKIGKL